MTMVVGLAAGCVGTAPPQSARPPRRGRKVARPKPELSRRPPVLPVLPSPTLQGALASDKLLVPLTKGKGSAPLRPYTPQGAVLYIQFACSGPGFLVVTGYFKYQPCNGRSAVMRYPRQPATSVSPVVEASSRTSWEIVITSGPAQTSPAM